MGSAAPRRTLHRGVPGGLAAAAFATSVLWLGGCSLGRGGDGDNDGAGTTTSFAPSTTEEVEARVFYTVQRGDTLVQIANNFDIDLNSLVRENGIADPTKIFVGQQLLIPPPLDEAEGPQLTIAPPTDPDLPPVQTTLTITSTTLPQPTAPSE